MFNLKTKDPFCKMLCRMFMGSLCSLGGGLVMGIILGLIVSLIDVVGGGAFRGSQMLYFAVPGMMLGSILGAIFGGLFGFFRKD